MTTAQRFGANLAHLRRASGLTQEQLASLCELHRTEVSLLERGGRELRLGTIVKLAGALSTDIDTLLEGIAWVPPTTAPGRFEFYTSAAGFRAAFRRYHDLSSELDSHLRHPRKPQPVAALDRLPALKVRSSSDQL